MVEKLWANFFRFSAFFISVSSYTYINDIYKKKVYANTNNIIYIDYIHLNYFNYTFKTIPVYLYKSFMQTSPKA